MVLMYMFNNKISGFFFLKIFSVTAAVSVEKQAAMSSDEAAVSYVIDG